MSSLSNTELVKLFVVLALDQDEALLAWDSKKANRLFWEIREIAHELRSRLGDQRRELLSLYAHENPQVRLKAAESTLAVAPGEARQVLEDLRAINGPQSLDAGMLVRGLDDGSFKPM